MNLKRLKIGLVALLAVCMAAIPSSRAIFAADEELSIEEESVPAAVTAPAPASNPATAVKPAISKPATAKASVSYKGALIMRINVVPGSDKVEIRVEGKGKLVPVILKLADENKLVLDFKGASYKAPGIIMGAPGIGDVLQVRGGQFQAGIARVVIELKKMVTYTSVSKPGAFTLSLATLGTVGPEEEAAAAPASAAAPVSSPAVVPANTPAPVSPVVEPTPPASASTGTEVRSRLLHAMVSDLDDRVRLVATSDGVVKYKIASQDGGKELVLSLYDMDLKWSRHALISRMGLLPQYGQKRYANRYNRLG